MKENKRTRLDVFYGLWISIVIGVITALSLNLMYLLERENSSYMSYKSMLIILEISLIGASIGVFIKLFQEFIIYKMRDIKNKHHVGVTLLVSSYGLTYLISYIFGYKEKKSLIFISLIPSIYGLVFGYFEYNRVIKLNCGLQKKKEELEKRLKDGEIR